MVYFYSVVEFCAGQASAADGQEETRVGRTLLFSGLDVQAPEIPDEAQVVSPPISLPPLDNFHRQVTLAFQQPLGSQPLERLVRPGMRVTLVVDDPSLPVPPATSDCRREMVEAVIRELTFRGLRRQRISILLANGLSRKWRSSELLELFGPEIVASGSVFCHDVDETSNLIRIAEEEEGPIEFNRRAVETDLLIYVNVVSLPLLAGLYGLTSGTTGYRTARFLAGPSVLESDPAPLLPGSKVDLIHQRVSAHLLKKVPIFQISSVLNCELWASGLASLLQREAGLSRPLQIWNSLPMSVKRRAARLLRANYRPICVFAGKPSMVAERSLDFFYRQHQVDVFEDADILVFGLPDQGPASVRSSQNPVLAANLALGYVANLYSTRPLLRRGGVLIFANPLLPEFDQSCHRPHQEFYEKVLRFEREPSAIHERFEAHFAGRPEYVADYQGKFAFHGAHPLYAWYLCTAARRQAGWIISAHGDPRACARLGFGPARDVEEALAKAREFLGKPNPAITVLEIPPPFWSKLRS